MYYSGVNADARNIPNGCPIGWLGGRQELDRVVRAGGGITAIGLASSGAIQRGVVVFLQDGSLSLDDWTLVTGTKTLTEGSIYRLGAVGMLTTTGTGQIIGLASSVKEMRLAIDRTGTMVDSSSAATTYVLATDFSDLSTLVNNHIANAAIHAPVSIRSWPIPNGVSADTVTGLALASVPANVLVTVLKPSGGQNLSAQVVAGTITADGFSYTLNGETESADYKLIYQIV